MATTSTPVVRDFNSYAISKEIVKILVSGAVLDLDQLTTKKYVDGLLGRIVEVVDDSSVANGSLWVQKASGKVMFKDGVGSSSELGVATFKALKDTPADYAAQAKKLVRVNAAADAVEYTDSINAGSF